MDCVKEVNIKEAKARFSQLLHRVAFGGDLMTIPDDFDAPLPDEILNAFEGKSRQKKA